jgi:hypothetical protein
MTEANGATRLVTGLERGALERQACRRATAGLRLLPDYLIIGAQGAGTTSLHRWSCPDLDSAGEFTRVTAPLGAESGARPRCRQVGCR